MSITISKLGVALSCLLLVFTAAGAKLLEYRTQGPDTAVNLTLLPQQIGDWKSIEAEPLDASAQDILRLDQFIRRLYRNSAGDGVFVYVGYWQKQSGEHQAAKHSPLMCLPANGWKISEPELRSIPIAGGNQPARQLVGVIQDQTVIFYYWFFSGEENYVDETDALFRIMHETIFNGRSDGGIVELSLDLNKGSTDPKRGEAVLESFVKEFAPELRKTVANAGLAVVPAKN